MWDTVLGYVPSIAKLSQGWFLGTVINEGTLSWSSETAPQPALYPLSYLHVKTPNSHLSDPAWKVPYTMPVSLGPSRVVHPPLGSQ